MPVDTLTNATPARDGAVVTADRGAPNGRARAATAAEDDLEALIEVLRATSEALLASELFAGCGERGLTRERAEAALRALERRGRALVVVHPPPDPHLAHHDLRVVAAFEHGPDAGRAEAAEAAGRRWANFERGFLSTRCCR
jgi:hypothetical protein